MLSNDIKQGEDAKIKFMQLYNIMVEREKYLDDEAKVAQYASILRFYMKYLQAHDNNGHEVGLILYWIYVKLGDIYNAEAFDSNDIAKFYLSLEYYNLSLPYAPNKEERKNVLLSLKDIYYKLDDKEAYHKVEEMWVENHNKENKFEAYMILAQNAQTPDIKAKFLEKSLDEVMSKKDEFINKYQDTLYVCGQLIAIYEIMNENEKVIRIKKLRDNTLSLLN